MEREPPSSRSLEGGSVESEAQGVESQANGDHGQEAAGLEGGAGESEFRSPVCIHEDEWAKGGKMPDDQAKGIYTGDVARQGEQGEDQKNGQ